MYECLVWCDLGGLDSLIARLLVENSGLASTLLVSILFYLSLES